MNNLPSKDDLESLRILVNNQPEKEFCGLSPNEMHDVLYDTFDKDSPLRINRNLPDSVLDKIPFFRLTEEFLKLVDREKKIKLTPLGALPKKVLTELYSHRFILEYGVEIGIHTLTREHDSNAITMVHYNSVAAGLMRKVTGKLVLTKEGARMLDPKNRNELFIKTLQAFTEKLPWSELDGFPAVPVGNLGWGFTTILLLKYGSEKRPMKFYAEKYMKAFPAFMYDFQKPFFGTPEEYFNRCYTLRSFDRFLEWWGFVSIDHLEKRTDRENFDVITSSVLKEVFMVK